MIALKFSGNETFSQKRRRHNASGLTFANDCLVDLWVVEVSPPACHSLQIVPFQTGKVEVLLGADENEWVDHTVYVEQKFSRPVHEKAQSRAVLES